MEILINNLVETIIYILVGLGGGVGAKYGLDKHKQNKIGRCVGNDCGESNNSDGNEVIKRLDKIMTITTNQTDKINEIDKKVDKVSLKVDCIDKKMAKMRQFDTKVKTAFVMLDKKIDAGLTDVFKMED